MLGDQDNCDFVSRSRWIEPETYWCLSPVSLPFDHNHPVIIKLSYKLKQTCHSNKLGESTLVVARLGLVNWFGRIAF